jgi:drug/metabolite transporter (DMT)-like permease
MSAVTRNIGTQPVVTKVVAAFAAIYLIWGTTYLAIRVGVETIPPFMMAGVRYVLAGGVVMAVLLARGVSLPRRLHWRTALVVGGLMLVGGNGLLTLAEQQVASGLAALIVATAPMWMALLEWLAFRGKRPSAQVAAGLAIGFAGIALLIDPSQLSGKDLVGVGVVLAATLFWAIGGLYSRRAPTPDNTLMGVAAEMLVGGLSLLVLSAVTGEPARLDLQAVSLNSVLAMLYLGVFGSIVGYTAFIWLLKTVDPAKVATNAYVNPVIAVFLGWLVLGEVVTLQTVIAMGIILIGVLVINTKPTVFARIQRARVFRSAASPGISGD